jgi:hypothetical protein
MSVIIGRVIVTGNDPPPTLMSKPGDQTAPPATPAPHFALYGGTVYKQVVGADLDGNASLNILVPLPKNYDGLQVSANLGDTKQCPLGDEEFNSSELACLILDAPTWSVPSPSASAQPGEIGSLRETS